MISLIEHGESSPTAAILDRLAAGLGVSLASLFSNEESCSASPLARRVDQYTWRDPGTGYMRRNLSPPGYPSRIELVEVVLPAGARVTYDTGIRTVNISQQVWIIDGDIVVTIGRETYRLTTDDCLAMRVDQLVVFQNLTDKPSRHLVALSADRNGSIYAQR